MSKRKSGAYMSPGEQIAGTVFFAVYLLVLPFAAAPLFDLAELLLGITLSSAMETLIYYYILLAVTVIIFHGFLARTSRRLLDNLDGTVKTVLAGPGGPVRPQRAGLPPGPHGGRHPHQSQRHHQSPPAPAARPI